MHGYEPKVGDLVWQQMYDPQMPAGDSTIQERIAGGMRYGERRQMIVRHVVPHYDPTAYARSLGRKIAQRFVTRWVLQEADPARRRDECRGYSWVEDDWCVLELVDPADDGRLF